ncbi:MAG: hypothetical protein J6W40_04590 [Alphaproteobacteria bacterium]|nr:hypothetical protein [Alphaproteobacteria bacterium]
MKKLTMVLLGLLMVALVVALLFFASAIYDTAARESVTPYFFQTNELSVMRPGLPVRESELGETAMREMLIKKYVTEYFYAIPDEENIAVRTQAGTSSTMALMSKPEVFDEWLNGEAETIKYLAKHKKMRTVAVDGRIYKPADSDYWVVPYTLYTWDYPNDMSIKPTVSHGTLLMDVYYSPGIREAFNGEKFLKAVYNHHVQVRGIDPSAALKFGVNYLENRPND